MEADVVAPLAQPPPDLVEQPCLSDPVVAADGDHARIAPGSGGERLADATQLVLAPDEAPERLRRSQHVLDQDAESVGRAMAALRGRLELEEIPHGPHRLHADRDTPFARAREVARDVEQRSEPFVVSGLSGTRDMNAPRVHAGTRR